MSLDEIEVIVAASDIDLNVDLAVGTPEYKYVTVESDGANWMVVANN